MTKHTIFKTSTAITLWMFFSFQICNSAIYNWINTTTGNISYPTNWSTGNVPSQNNNVSFDVGNIVIIDQNLTVKNVTFINNDPIIVNIDYKLKLNGNLTIDTPNSVTLINNDILDTKRIDINQGTLLISGTGGASDKIKDSTKISFNGGTLAFTDNTTESFGTLTLTSNSSIDLGTGSNIITFDDYGSFSFGQELQILNWNTSDAIMFNTQPNINELHTIKFINPYGDGNDFYGAWNIDRVIPLIPELKPYWNIVFILLFLIGYHIKNKKSRT